MKESINWLEVVMDYGKRFPTATIKSLGLKTCDNIIISDLLLTDSTIPMLQVPHGYNCTNSYHFAGNKHLIHYSGFRNSWKPVPKHILLRLLTDGKEDLI